MVNVALVPAYHPTGAIIPLVKALRNNFDAVVVIDDGSGEACRAYFTELATLAQVTVLVHAVNLGKGAALRTGINHICIHHPGAGIVTVDADGQHRPEDAAAVGQALAARPGHLVLGTRRFKGDIPLRSKLGNTLTRGLLRVFENIDLSDTQTGLRGIPPELAPLLLTLPSQRYEFELDMLILARRRAVPMAEIAIETIYVDGNASSHFNPIRDSFRIYFCLFRFLIIALITAMLENLVFLSLLGQDIPVEVAQFTSRTLAIGVNFTLLRRYVFGLVAAGQFWRYIVSVGVFGLLSYSLLSVFAEWFGLGIGMAKILAETLLFPINFVVQRDIVFTRSGDNPG
jgi:putative flippase GtrA